MSFVKRNKEIILFTIVELAALILNLVLTGKANVIASKCIIYTNLLFALLFTLFINKKSFVVFALVFTAVSDTLLVSSHEISETARIIALVSFIIVQSIYLVELSKENKKVTIYIGFSDLFLIVALCVASIFIFKDQYNALIPLTIVYFVILVSNLVNSAINFKKESTMFFGFLFFIMCDILIGLGTAVSLGIFRENSFINFMLKFGSYAWTFYIIAQYFLVSSIKSKQINKLFD